MKKAFLTLLFISGMANASCWTQYATSSFAEHYIDMCSLSIDGKYKKVWLKEVRFKAGDKHPLGEADYFMQKYLNYYDCKARKTAVISSVRYRTDEPTGSETISPKDAFFSEIIPDSIGEIDLNMVCQKK